MWVVPHDLAILAGPGLRFVGVDNEVVWALGIDGLGHERPFEAGGEPRSPAAAQARGFHFRDDPVASLVDDRLGPIPIAARPRALEPAVAEPIQIGEDTILVFQHRSVPGLPGRKVCMGCLVLGSTAAGGEFCRLGDPLLTIDPAGKREIRADPPNLASHPRGDLIEVKDAEFVQAFLIDGTDPLDPLQVVRTVPTGSFDGEGASANRVSLLLSRGVAWQGRQRRVDVGGLRLGVNLRSRLVERRGRLIVCRRGPRWSGPPPPPARPGYRNTTRHPA